MRTVRQILDVLDDKAATARRLRAGAAAAIIVMVVAASAIAAPDAGPITAAPTRADAGVAADSDSARLAFEAALDRLGHDDAAAAQGFEAIAASAPASEYADDGLMQAAQLYEEKLGDPARAEALYARLLALYPTSRLSLRARARVDFLSKNLAAGAAPLAEYQRILLGYATRPPEESARRMEELLRARPDFPLVDQGLLWLANQAARDRRYDEAERRFIEIETRFPERDAAGQAFKGRADTLLGAGRPLRALRMYQALIDGRPPAPPLLAGAIRDAARAGVRHALTALVRLGAFYASLLYVAIFLGVSLWRARPLRARGLPTELLYYAPVASVFVLAGLRQSRAIASAIGYTALGGAAVVYAAAVALDDEQAARARRFIGRALAVSFAVLALFYAALYAADVLDFVQETILHGPDR